jgi:outer membrane lipoprotein SlyB
LAACASDRSENAQTSEATRQSNVPEHGVIVGVRPVTQAWGDGVAAGDAASGMAQAGMRMASVERPLDGLAARPADHAIDGPKTLEYLVRKSGGGLISVTQSDTPELSLGQKVLLAVGVQARIVPDDRVEPTASGARIATMAPEPPGGDRRPAPERGPVAALQLPDTTTASPPLADDPPAEPSAIRSQEAQPSGHQP